MELERSKLRASGAQLAQSVEHEALKSFTGRKLGTKLNMW